MRDGKVRKILCACFIVFLMAVAFTCALAETAGGSEVEGVLEVSNVMDESWASTLTTFVLFAALVVVTLLITGFVLYRKQKNKYEDMIACLNTQMSNIKKGADAKLKVERDRYKGYCDSIKYTSERNLEKMRAIDARKICELKENIESLQVGLDLYREQYRRALVLHPSLEDEINHMIANEKREHDIECARAFDEAASEFDGRSATRQMFEDLKKTMELYNRLTPAQKTLVCGDVKRIKQMLEESTAFKKKYEQETRAYV